MLVTKPPMRIVCISDTHAMHEGLVVPEGDLLIHAGDCTNSGDLEELAEFDAWLGSQPHPHKVLVAGNHDFAFQREPAEARARIRSATYLQDGEVEIESLRIWGSPWQPWFFDWAFNLERGEEIRAKWSLIPAGVDILVTHGPPLGHGDRTFDARSVGCADLLEAIRRLQPRLHVFGHIHEGYGQTREGTTRCVNASSWSASSRPLNPPIVVEL